MYVVLVAIACIAICDMDHKKKIELDSRVSTVPLLCSHEASPPPSGRTAVDSIRGDCLGPHGGDPRSVTQRPVSWHPMLSQLMSNRWSARSVYTAPWASMESVTWGKRQNRMVDDRSGADDSVRNQKSRYHNNLTPQGMPFPADCDSPFSRPGLEPHLPLFHLFSYIKHRP